MATCFICNDKLFKEQRSMCSSITQHSKVSYPEKIVEVMGEEFVIILTPSDHICIKCDSLLNHMDKLEIDLKLVKSTLSSSIHKKFGLLPTVPPVNSVDVDNDHLIPDREPQVDQNKVSRTHTKAQKNDSMDVDNNHLIPDREPQVDQNKVSSTHEKAQKHDSIDVDSNHLIPNGELQVDQNKVSGYKVTPKKPIRTSSQKIIPQNFKISLYGCDFCPVKSKDFEYIRTHMNAHKEAILGIKKPKQIATQPLRNLLPPIKALFRCDLCTSYFETQSACLNHVHKSHKGIHTFLFNDTIKERKIASPTIKPAEPLITEENCNMLFNIEDGGQEDYFMDIDTLLNDIEFENMMPLPNITGNVNTMQFFTENDENASGYDQERINID